jgi:hypothetical protein
MGKSIRYTRQFFGIDFFTMLNSAIQLDLNFNFSRMNLLDKVFVESKISLTYIKSLFIQFSKTIGLLLYKLIFSYLEESKLKIFR